MKHLYEDRESDDDMLFFGQDFGDGSDENYFHVGMTSIQLLKRCIDGKRRLYHIDATYKVIKLNTN